MIEWNLCSGGDEWACVKDILTLRVLPLEAAHRVQDDNAWEFIVQNEDQVILLNGEAPTKADAKVLVKAGAQRLLRDAVSVLSESDLS